ncbi:MAG: Ig-like domain-containing protein, partial [Lachnospiraceae bacterium]|nr:Ig-like domain-containing protein [Lachnospiraceae bacterium]
CGAKETVADGINTQPAQGVMDDADTETDVVVQEVIKEVTVVSTVTNTISEDEIVVDTVSDYAEAFTDSVDITGREPVYLSQHRFFESNGGTIWASDDTDIAVVSQYGEVTAVNEGLTTIRCMDDSGNQTASYDIYCTTRNDGQNVRVYTEFSDDYVWDYYNYSSPEELQAKITNINDLIKFMLTRGMYYDNNAPVLADYGYTWAMDAETFLTNNSGVCCDVSNLATYLLQYDYEEIGWIYHAGSGVGHAYNYVYEDGSYYVFDLTDVLCCNDNRYSDFSVRKVDTLSDFVPEILERKTDPERLLGIVAVNSLNHTEQPANYMSYMTDDTVIFNEKVYNGFEEGVPFEVLYINPKAEGLVEYISIPHEEIPRQVPSWFRDEIEDKMQWDLY